MTSAGIDTQGTALYYPYIHPRKMGHMKAALLYWDRVRRIVPREMQSDKWVADDDDEARALAEHDLLIATRPDLHGYDERAAERFFQHIKPEGERFRIDVGTGKDLAEAGRGIHYEKIGFETIRRLQDMGVAERFGDWVAMRDEVASFYMFCLASEMSRSLNAPLLSDTPKDVALGESLLFEPDPVVMRGDQGQPTTSDELLSLGIRFPSPEQMGDIPTKDLAKFSKKRAPERQRFRNAIEGIMGAVRGGGDPNRIEDYLSRERTNIKEAVDDLNKSITDVCLGGLATAAKITAPAGIVSLAALTPAVAGMLTTLGIALVFVASVLETRGKLRKARIASPYHYLISVEGLTGIPTI